MTEARDLRPAPRSRRRSTVRRSAARLAAVQALYQCELTGETAVTVVDEFRSHRLGGADVEASGGATANDVLFGELVYGVISNSDAIDPRIAEILPDDWPLERLEVVLRCILRTGAYELMYRLEAPAAVVVSEYTRLAHSFFAGGEPNMTNRVLDRLARTVRPGELEARDDGAGRPAR